MRKSQVAFKYPINFRKRPTAEHAGLLIELLNSFTV
jgi:hypothetical protein